MSSVVQTRNSTQALKTLPEQPVSALKDDPLNGDAEIPDNYVQYTLKKEKSLPPVRWDNILNELVWLNVVILGVTPIIGVIGVCYTKLQWRTAVFAACYYYFTGLGKLQRCTSPRTYYNRPITGITAGYHRLWAHRSYNASKPLQYILAALGAGSVEGSIKWWARGHRAHHRYTDTELDPYNAHKGLLWSHVGWMIIKPRRKAGVADISDLTRNPVIKWQHKNYILLMLIMAFTVPTIICGLGWGDWKGGYVYAGVVRLIFVHHVCLLHYISLSIYLLILLFIQSTFCVNSLAHWLGDSPFDDKHTPRDHLITALVTIGEGYHNFHHQFPMDYRNAFRWYQYDPTKWFIWVCQKIGLASHLKVSNIPSANESHS